MTGWSQAQGVTVAKRKSLHEGVRKKKGGGSLRGEAEKGLARLSEVTEDHKENWNSRDPLLSTCGSLAVTPKERTCVTGLRTGSGSGGAQGQKCP